MYKHKKPKSPKPQHPTPADTATETFLKEVDEAIQEERLKKFWETWKIAILGGVAALFVGSIGWQWHGQHQAAQKITAAESWYAARSLPQLSESELVALTTSGVTGIELLAQFKQAEDLATAGNHAQAVTVYEGIIQHTSTRNIRSLAILMAGIAEINIDLTAAQTRLSAQDVENNPYRASVLTYLAEIAELKNENAAALALWERVELIPATPQALRQQAQDRAARIRALAT